MDSAVFFSLNDFFQFSADLSPKELEIAKIYPPHTALCIRDGWEFCRPELAAGYWTCSYILDYSVSLPLILIWNSCLYFKTYFDFDLFSVSTSL